MSKITNYHDYFKSLAVQHKAIQHKEENPKFTRIEENEDTILLHRTIDTITPCVLLQYHSSQLRDLRADNTHEVFSFSLFIVQRCEKDNWEEQRATLAQLRQIAYDFIGKMYLDKCNIGEGVPYLEGFDRNTVRIAEVYGQPQALDVGIQLFVNLHHSVENDMYYNPDNWL